MPMITIGGDNVTSESHEGLPETLSLIMNKQINATKYQKQAKNNKHKLKKQTKSATDQTSIQWMHPQDPSPQKPFFLWDLNTT